MSIWIIKVMSQLKKNQRIWPLTPRKVPGKELYRSILSNGLHGSLWESSRCRLSWHLHGIKGTNAAHTPSWLGLDQSSGVQSSLEQATPAPILWVCSTHQSLWLWIYLTDDWLPLQAVTLWGWWLWNPSSFNPVLSLASCCHTLLPRSIHHSSTDNLQKWFSHFRAHQNHPEAYLNTDGWGLPWWLRGKKSICQCKRHRFDPRSRWIPQAKEQLSLCATATKPVL